MYYAQSHTHAQPDKHPNYLISTQGNAGDAQLDKYVSKHTAQRIIRFQEHKAARGMP